MNDLVEPFRKQTGLAQVPHVRVDPTNRLGFACGVRCPERGCSARQRDDFDVQAARVARRRKRREQPCTEEARGPRHQNAPSAQLVEVAAGPFEDPRESLLARDAEQVRTIGTHEPGDDSGPCAHLPKIFTDGTWLPWWCGKTTIHPLVGSTGLGSGLHGAWCRKPR